MSNAMVLPTVGNSTSKPTMIQERPKMASRSNRYTSGSV